jgi:hypothetical protein
MPGLCGAAESLDSVYRVARRAAGGLVHIENAEVRHHELLCRFVEHGVEARRDEGRPSFFVRHVFSQSLYVLF